MSQDPVGKVTPIVGRRRNVARAAEDPAFEAAPVTTADVVDRRQPVTGLSFVVAPRAVLWVGLTLVAALSLASIIGQVLIHGVGLDGRLITFYGHVTAVNREASLPTWFQSMMLLACAAALWTVADLVRARGERWEAAWRLLAVAFAYLSVDEFLALHERIIGPLRSALNLTGVFYLAWVLVALPIALLLVVVLIPFLRSLPRRTLVAFVVSGSLYVLGTIGIEMIGSSIVEAQQTGTVRYSLISGGEELLEMLGMTLFLASVADHRQRHVSR